MVRRRPNANPDIDAARLTPRQRDVLHLLSFRLTNAEIAAVLSLSPRTVECHVASILSSLHVANRREAAARAMLDRDPRARTAETTLLNRGHGDFRPTHGPRQNQ